VAGSWSLSFDVVRADLVIWKSLAEHPPLKPFTCEQMQQSCALFDHLVGKREQRWRHFEHEHLGGFEVEREFECRRLQNRPVLRLNRFRSFPTYTPA
jgi:hypothetical protein